MPPRNPAEEEPTDWRAWLSLLAPLATGAIVGGASGNTAGVSTAARASMAEVDRRDKLDAEIRKSRAKLLEKRKVASEKPSYQTIYDEETGKNLRYAVWDAGDGTLRKELVGVDKKPPESYTEVGYVDESGKPVVGTMQRSTGQKGPVLGGKPESPAASNQAEINSRFDRQKQFQIYQDFIKPTSLFNVKKANVSGISKAVDLLNSGSPLGASGVRNIIARNVLGEKGPLSDGDVTRLAGDPSAQALVARFYEKWVAGKLTEDDRKDAYAVLKIAMKLEREDALREANNVVKSSQALGYDIADPINKYVSGALKEMPEFTPGGKVTKQIRTKNGIFNVLEDGTLVPVRK
jgi:hypothetical protein